MKETQERKAIVPYQANTIERERGLYLQRMQVERKLKRKETWPRRRLKKTRKVIREMWALAFIYIYILYYYYLRSATGETYRLGLSCLSFTQLPRVLF